MSCCTSQLLSIFLLALQEDADSVEEEEEEQESVAAPRLGDFDALAVEESDEEAPSSTQTPEARKPEEAARPEEVW